MEKHYGKSDNSDEQCLDDIVRLIRENCPSATVAPALIERVAVACDIGDEVDVANELMNSGFKVRIKTNGKRSVINAERLIRPHLFGKINETT